MDEEAVRTWRAGTAPRWHLLADVLMLHEGMRRYLRTNPCPLVLDGYKAVAQDMEILAFLERLPEPGKALSWRPTPTTSSLVIS